MAALRGKHMLHWFTTQSENVLWVLWQPTELTRLAIPISYPGMYMYIYIYLVGGIPTPMKNMSSSVGIIIPNWMGKNKKCSKPPTRYSRHQYILQQFKSHIYPYSPYVPWSKHVKTLVLIWDMAIPQLESISWVCPHQHGLMTIRWC